MAPLLRRLAGVAHAYSGVLRSRSYFPLWLGQLLSAPLSAIRSITSRSSSSSSG
jgi:hypothetical protein